MGKHSALVRRWPQDLILYICFQLLQIIIIIIIIY
jgi:hypothetical protein